MGRRPRTRERGRARCRRPGSWPPSRSSSRKQEAPSTPASRSAGQWRARRVDQDDAAWRRTSRRGRGRRAAARRGVPATWIRCVSAIQIGKLVMTGPDEPSSGWPTEAITAASSRYCVGGGARARAERRQQRDREERASRRCRAALRARRPAGSSRAGARPARSGRRARAAPRSTSRTWNGPAAWRNVPHVVATGKTRLVTRNVAKLTMTSGRIAAPRIAHGRPMRPISEIGSPGRSRTLNRLWAKPSTRISTSRAGPTAR